MYCDGLVLDLRGRAEPNAGISLEALRTALALNGGQITRGSAVLLRTGQESYDLADQRWYEYPGMTREGTLWLAEPLSGKPAVRNPARN